MGRRDFVRAHEGVDYSKWTLNPTPLPHLEEGFFFT